MGSEVRPSLTDFACEYDPETDEIKAGGVPIARVFNSDDLPCMDDEGRRWLDLVEVPAIGHLMAEAPALRGTRDILLEALREIAFNAKNLRDGGLPHFSRNDFARAVLDTAESAFKRAGTEGTPTSIRDFMTS